MNPSPEGGGWLRAKREGGWGGSHMLDGEEEAEASSETAMHALALNTPPGGPADRHPLPAREG
jgi:hypothetical protein